MDGDPLGVVATELASARQARRNLDPDEHLAGVDRLEKAVDALPPGPERDRFDWTVKAERLRDIGYYVTDEDALRDGARTAERGLAAIGRDPPDVAARFRLALGQVAARLRDRDWLEEATRHLNAAARAFIDADEPEEAAAALSVLAWSVQLSGGGLRDARDSLTQALSLTADASMRAGLLAHRAQVHVWLGRLDDAQADVEAAWTLVPESDDRAATYVAWYTAVIASLRGQRAATESWVARGDARRGGFADNNVTGLWYDAMVTDALARVGAEEAARERLAQLLPHVETEPTPVEMAQVAFEARFGDAALATRAWEAVRTRPDIEQWEVARLRLLLAVAAEREGHDPGPIAAEAFDLCAALEEPGVLLTIEPDAARVLLPAAAAAGSVVASRLHDDRPRWRVRVLGDFAIVGPDGSAVQVGGQIRRLVAHLAIAGQAIGRDSLPGLLWPQEPPESVRGRSRQLVHRARALLPDVLTTDAGRIGIDPEVLIDLDAFNDALRRALAASDDVLRAAAARRALDHVHGDLLADEVIDTDWLTDLRARIAGDIAWLHTVLAEEAVRHDHVDDALTHARAALEADPANEQAAALAMDLLRRAGRRGEAQAVLRTTAAALATVDLEPGRDLERARARLHRRPPG